MKQNEHIVKLDISVNDVHIPASIRKPMNTYTDEGHVCSSSCLEQCKVHMTPDEYSVTKARIEEAEKKMSETTEMEVECSLRGDSIELKEPGEEGKQIWIQLAKPGKFKGHAAGPFEMNARTFSEIVHNFNNQANQAIPVDFEHASEQAATEGSIPYNGAPAQGWITSLELRADGNLWGLVEWLPLARKYIKNKQYRYLSPAIVFGAKDRVTGKSIGAKLSSVALTNNPFLDGMQPVAAKNIQNVDLTAFDAVRTTLEMPSYATPGMLLKMLKAVDQDALRQRIGDSLRNALRLPLTMSVENVFAEARMVCGEVRQLELTEKVQDSTSAVPAANENKTPVTAKEIAMSDAKDKELQTQVDQLTLKLTAADAEVKNLRATHAAELETLRVENAALKKKVDEQTERELSDLVDVTMATWGEKKGLTEIHRPILMRQAKANREDFLTMYPIVPPAQRHLTQNLTGEKTNPLENAPTKVPQDNNVIRLRDVVKDENIPPVEEIAKKLMKDEGLSYEQAFSEAHTRRLKLIETAATKRVSAMGGV